MISTAQLDVQPAAADAGCRDEEEDDDDIHWRSMSDARHTRLCSGATQRMRLQL